MLSMGGMTNREALGKRKTCAQRERKKMISLYSSRSGKKGPCALHPLGGGKEAVSTIKQLRGKRGREGKKEGEQKRAIFARGTVWW